MSLWKKFVGGATESESGESAELTGKVAAIDRVQAVIEFELDGTIVHANNNFLTAMGYELDEVQGRHHRMFVDEQYAASDAYRKFWERLNRGEFEVGEFKRRGKGGREVWIQASYNPLFDEEGKPVRVVKFATDVTAEKLRNAEVAGQLEAISKSQATIEFNLDGTIREANENFLNAMGYRLDEIKGRHHRMFVDEDYANSSEYREFWNQLNAGQFASGEYHRVGKGGREIWIQASYNPIFDLNGKPTKVVKYASDITEQKILHRTVEKVLGDASKVMNAMAGGDLTQRMPDDTDGEFRDLAVAMNSSLDNLIDVISQMNGVAATVASGSTEISSGNTDLSSRTEAQASSLEESAASITQIADAAKRNAESAGEANQLAKNALTQAKKGGAVVNDAVTAMEEISAASTKIAAIIGVIDEIAFQTNLLALNASVEAARAGEQGRGFAVVASEVRNLAGRSATAAKEIKELIKDSGEKVEGGAALVNESGKTLEGIVQGVQQVADIVGDIAHATEQQSGSAEQVSLAVRDMEQMTQQNAALVEEAAAASESLSEEAKRLSSLTGSFNVQGAA